LNDVHPNANADAILKISAHYQQFNAARAYHEMTCNSGFELELRIAAAPLLRNAPLFQHFVLRIAPLPQIAAISTAAAPGS
jgi:hypothetical protein